MTVTFTHHPRDVEAWDFDPTRIYEQTERGFKPEGFWLSADGDWRRWCEDEQLDWANSEAVHFEVDTDRFLWLKTIDDIDRFDADYVGTQDPYYIDWRPLSEQHSGIIIAPYQWQRRLSSVRWYYPWDCASACVWDLSAIRVATSVNA